jgi:hypothetical protein
MLPEYEIGQILKKFGPKILSYLTEVGYFDLPEGPYKPIDVTSARAMRKYLTASKAKNTEVWGVVERYLLPELEGKGERFIELYGLKPVINVKEIATDYMDSRGGELITQMTRTDQKRITNFIWNNSEKNERVLARDIMREPELANITQGHRAATIIRTERNHAVGASTSDLATRAGATTHTRHEVMDERTREEHRPLNNETKPIDEPYSNGEMYCGEIDINCRGWETFGFDKEVASNPDVSDSALEELYA